MTNQQISDFDAAGIPQDAIKRLAELQPGKAGSIFTSDLSVNEFLLVREVGFRPLGLVLGTSIYHVGLQVGRWGKNQELNVLSQAMYHARELAMIRMEAEADALRRRRHRGRAARRGNEGVRRGHRRVHRGRHRREGRAGRGRRRGHRTGGTTSASRSPPTCPARTSGR